MYFNYYIESSFDMFIYTCKEGSKVNSEESDFRGHWKVVIGTFISLCR